MKAPEANSPDSEIVRLDNVGTFRRVALVAPVEPFRSGIAKHSTMLARSLAEQCEALRVFSFSRQYPGLLFPGESDRDLDVEPPSDVHFILDSINPLSWRRTAREIAAFAPDLVILPTWTFFMAPCQRAITTACRASGIHVRLLCHNVFDHDSVAWKRLPIRRLLDVADSFITHTDEMASQIRVVRPDAPVLVHPHPIYDQYPPPTRDLPRKADLELLFFGLVRPYKGLDVAIRAMASLKGHGSIYLRVVGEYWKGREATEAAIREAGLEDRVELVPRYVSDSEAADYFARADAVVLPYRSATGSGVVPLAYHYGKPVVVTDLPGLVSLVRHGETGWIVPLDDAEALAATIRDLSADDCVAMRGGIETLKRELSWESLARQATTF